MEKPVQVNFRMPAELKDKLETAAKESGRSTTAEIVARLEESLNTPSPHAVLLALARLEFQLSHKEVELARKGLYAGILGSYILAIEPQLDPSTLPTEGPWGTEEVMETARKAVEDFKAGGGVVSAQAEMARAADAATRLFRLTNPAGEPLPDTIRELLKISGRNSDTKASN